MSTFLFNHNAQEASPLLLNLAAFISIRLSSPSSVLILPSPIPSLFFSQCNSTFEQMQPFSGVNTTRDL
ncbi:hypothetical protein OFB79_25935, partial [Escherichia coli]|nr:hypothetical protein [Escherichia coli]